MFYVVSICTNRHDRGRYFNESTLPPLPNYATIPPRPVTKESIPPTPSSHAKPEARDVATETPPAPGRDASISPLTAAATVDNAQPRKEPPSAAPAQPHSELLAQPPAPEPTPDALPGPGRSAPSIPHPAEPSTSEQHANHPASIPALDAKGHEISPGQAVATHTGATTSLEGAEVPPANKKSDIHPSPFRPSQPTEQPFSPSSSVDPYSNNTPAPPTTSPDTSPAD